MKPYIDGDDGYIIYDDLRGRFVWLQHFLTVMEQQFFKDYDFYLTKIGEFKFLMRSENNLMALKHIIKTTIEEQNG